MGRSKCSAKETLTFYALVEGMLYARTGIGLTYIRDMTANVTFLLLFSGLTGNAIQMVARGSSRRGPLAAIHSAPDDH